MININKTVLANGLRIVHSRVDNTQMVALNILYNVGSKDEDENHTGFAHLFEHLMFSGSKNIENYDVVIQNAGGENNAWTNNDFTNYYVCVPKQNVEVAFWLESDRMFQLNINENSLAVQKNVVCEEFKQRTLNCPYGDVGHMMRDLVYKIHPYRWPTIGKNIEHIEKATLDIVYDFYRRYYAPNNAILAITGNIDFEEACRLAEKWFGDIPAQNVTARNLPQEPVQNEKRTLKVEREVPLDALYMSFRMSDRMSKDYYVFDIISDLLSNGKSSRMITNLVRKEEIFSDIDAYITGSIDSGMFQIVGRPNEGVSMERAEEAIWRELDNLKKDDIDEYELNKVKNKYESNFIFGNLNYLNLASNLAFYELLGDAELINKEIDVYASTTKEDIHRVLNEAFCPENCSVIYYHSKK